VKKIDLSRRLNRKKYKRILNSIIIILLGAILGSFLLNIAVKLPINSSKPVDAVLVLGGSVQREIRAARLANRYPDIPILIAHGSDDPCILSVFQEEGARLEKVWLEKCSESTFDNFFFSIPILRRWKVHKIKLVTSGTHVQRAKLMGKILLGTQGIAVEMDTVKEKGVPGNRESKLKTTLDVTRSIMWSFFSQFIHPSCSKLTELNNVDLRAWQKRKYYCEYKGGAKKPF
jgi:uncharacterized SAM-binding protein YcdF (DUF218 family)